MLRRVTALVVVTLAFATPARADTRADTSAVPTVPSMTLDQAVAYARAHQPQIRSALARVSAQRAAADVPRAQWLPTIGVTAQLFGMTANNTTGTYVGTGTFDLPRIGGTKSVAVGSWEPRAATIVGGGANQEVFDFGRIAAEAAAADARVAVEEERVRAATLDTVFNVQEAYFAVFAAKAIVKASDDAYDRAKSHRDYAKANVSAGLRPPIELTRAEADLARFDTGRMRARGGLLTAQAVLAAAIGSDAPAIDAAGAPSAPADLPAVDEAIRLASARDPRLLEALARVRAEEARTKALAAAGRPDLSLTATISGRAGGAQPSGTGVPADGDGFVPNVPNWDAGIVFSWPLFDATVDARVSASKAEQEARRADLDLVRHDQAAAVRQSYVAVQIARDELPALARGVEAAHANYEQADARFKSGLATSVELADAEAIRTESEIQLALGNFQLARARAAFGRTIAEGP
jgi:outer membrane protein